MYKRQGSLERRRQVKSGLAAKERKERKENRVQPAERRGAPHLRFVNTRMPLICANLQLGPPIVRPAPDDDRSISG
jgi:hypothetical protein